jgi:hypothetical protein
MPVVISRRPSRHWGRLTVFMGGLLISAALGAVAIVVLLVVRRDSAAEPLTPQRVCEQFVTAHLEAHPCRVMTTADWGRDGAPEGLTDSRRFVVASLCPDRVLCDSGGRIMSFDTLSDLRRQEAYYQALGEQNQLLSSWIFVNVRHRVLVQLNSEVPRTDALLYEAAVSEL